MSLAYTCDIPNCKNVMELSQEEIENEKEYPDIAIYVCGSEKAILWDVCDKHIEDFEKVVDNFLSGKTRKPKKVEKHSGLKPELTVEEKSEDEPKDLSSLIKKRDKAASEMRENSREATRAPKTKNTVAKEVKTKNTPKKGSQAVPKPFKLTRQNMKEQNIQSGSNSGFKKPEIEESNEVLIEPSYSSIVDLSATPSE